MNELQMISGPMKAFLGEHVDGKPLSVTIQAALKVGEEERKSKGKGGGGRGMEGGRRERVHVRS
jgi:hypothetical protein